MISGVKKDFLVAQPIKSLPAKTVNTGSIPGSGRCPEEGIGNPLQYSCLENFMGRGTWGAMGHKESDTTEQLTHIHKERKMRENLTQKY